MTEEDILRYPIGRFAPKAEYTSNELESFIAGIEILPGKVESLVQQFSPQMWDKTYRPDGWTARQVVHHLADAHLNAYVRFKWTLTEEKPIIKIYNEKAWANTPEIQYDPALALGLLKPLHKKWVGLLRSLNETQLTRSFIHPVTQREMTLKTLMALYAWHGEHHYHHLKRIAGQP